MESWIKDDGNSFGQFRSMEGSIQEPCTHNIKTKAPQSNSIPFHSCCKVLFLVRSIPGLSTARTVLGLFDSNVASVLYVCKDILYPLSLSSEISPYALYILSCFSLFGNGSRSPGRTAYIGLCRYIPLV